MTHDTHTLRFERVSVTGHEADRTTSTRRTDIEIRGEVYESHQGAGLVGFRTPDRDGVFFLLDDGTVEYDPHDPETAAYETGENGTIDEH